MRLWENNTPRLHISFVSITVPGADLQNILRTSTKGTIGPGRRLLAYLMLTQYITTVSPACASIFITMLHQLGAVSCIELQPHWLQQASAVLIKVQSHVSNQ